VNKSIRDNDGATGSPVLAVYRRLYDRFGPQGWWPGETSFEVVVGAILTQNTNWKNVEKAIANLKKAGALSPAKMKMLPRRRLAALIRPAGYYNVKAERLGNFLAYLDGRHGMDMDRLGKTPGRRLREELLSVGGIGPETADSILLYGCGKPYFVIDAYTKRIGSRHNFCPPRATYDEVQDIFTAVLPRRVKIYNEYHALIVRLGKDHCRPSNPRCGGCPLEPMLNFPGA
jgi:endonuclease-3 related protein